MNPPRPGPPRGPRPHGPGAGQLHPRRGHDHYPVPEPRHPSPRFRRGPRGYPFPRAGEPPAPAGRMKIDVLFSPAGLTPPEVAGRPVFVVDVLRASSVICAALHHGARGVVPVASAEEATRMAHTPRPTDVATAGEQNCEPIPGFTLGNSPLEMTETAVRPKTVVMTTTNGTRALHAAQGAAEVYVAAAVNLAVAGLRARDLLSQRKDLLILCGGRELRFGLDDAYAAGRLILAALEGRRRRKGLNDGALAAMDLVRRYGER